MAKALVLAGGLPQIEVIRQLKARGITTVLADGSAIAIGRPYADIFYQLNIMDPEAVRDLALREQVDFQRRFQRLHRVVAAKHTRDRQRQRAGFFRNHNDKCI